MTERRAAGAVVAVLCCLGLLGSCSGDREPAGSGTPTPASSPSIRTLTPLPLPPEPPPSGRLRVEMRQSSRDAALGRIQVWLDNDTRRPVTPTRIRYSDPRFRSVLRGDRLRLAPPGTERGYPLYLPSRPACGSRRAGGRLEVALAGRTVRLAVRDPTDVVGRYVDGRCRELAVSRVAGLSFADTVLVDHPGEGGTAELVLVVRPTGEPGHRLVVETVSGTPLLTAAGPGWRPGLRVTGEGPVRRIALPMRPARCDGHAFLEAAGATAFRITVRLDGERGQILLRMGPAGAAAAIAFARDSCGLGD